jgi:hypothetical protein
MLGIKVNTIYGSGIIQDMPELGFIKYYEVKMIELNQLGKDYLSIRDKKSSKNCIEMFKSEILGELEND